MEKRVPVVLYGLGPIGQGIARLALERNGLEVVAAIDVDPSKVGRDLAEVLGLRGKLDVTVSADAPSVLTSVGTGVVLHATGSSLPDVYAQIVGAVKAGLRVVSTCEELAFPWARHPNLAGELDALARRHGVAVLGTGVNPGFIMDTLILALSAVCQNVTRVQATRVVDARRRRLPLQIKVGAGLSIAEFRDRAANKRLGHVGLLESAMLVADALGWKLDDVRETIEPVVCEHGWRGDVVTVQPGQAAGLHQTLSAWSGGKEVISLDLQMYVGAKDQHDTIVLEGTPTLSVTVAEGTPGDMATAAMVVNAVPRIIAAPPGLLTMKDIAVVHSVGG